MKNIILLITTFFFIFSLVLMGQQQTSDGGYIIAGSTESYTNGETDFLVYKLNAAGQKQWRKNYGGLYWDTASMIKQTSDGGYIVAGISDSYTNPPGGPCDFLLYKLNAAGQKQWRKSFGGALCDHAYGVIQTSDSGFLVIGDTWNWVHGTFGDDEDFLVYKLSASGAKQWRKNYGGAEWDYGLRAVQTTDGGYAFVGYTQSYTNGLTDVLVYKVDAAGNKQWRKNYGGTEYEYGQFIRQTADGGYILCGRTDSYVHVTESMKGVSYPEDILVYKLNAAGAKQWRKNYGGGDFDEGYDIRQTAAGGYVFCGLTRSYTHGADDMIVYRVNAAGAKLWRKNYGGTLSDEAKYIAPCSDGGFMLFGSGYSYTNGVSDFLVYRLDAVGTKQWRKNYGGINYEFVYVWD